MSAQSNHIVVEIDLIKGCIRQDRKMQEMLYHLFKSKMYAVCLRYSKDASDAQDILQDGFMKVYKSIEKYREDGSFEGWIRKIFVNTSIEHFRKETKNYSDVDAKEMAVEDTSWSPLDNLAEKDIVKLIQKLSPGYRQVFNMYVIEGYSHKDISDILGITEGTSKSQLARAKVLLREMVEEKLNKTQLEHEPDLN